MTRIVGIDFGEVRIGIALSDPGRRLASPLKAIKAKKTLKETAEEILSHLKMHEPIECIVLGLPLFLNGKESPSSKKVRELATFLEEISGKKVIFWDERLTTAQVQRTLKEAQFSRKKQMQYIDAMAAGLILQSFLDSPCNKSLVTV